MMVAVTVKNVCKLTFCKYYTVNLGDIKLINITICQLNHYNIGDLLTDLCVSRLQSHFLSGEKIVSRMIVRMLDSDTPLCCPIIKSYKRKYYINMASFGSTFQFERHNVIIIMHYR